ncbi:hypothetical protein RhiirB3_468958 [Rhizophagus irregularis]|nr:hypothetical protein RhiirB3_468958 [Rhizophagus irregularis]
MAENTHSKSNKRSSQKTQFENHTNNLSDEEMVAETYKAKEKASSSSQATKKLKKAEASSSLSSPNNNDNNMIIDDKNEMEHPISSEPNVSSHDASTNVSQTPITNSQDAMDTDLPENNSNKGITQGSADTQITSDTNNDVNSHNLEIFKEYNSRSDSQYILFFMRDQFDKEKSNNEILNDLKNAFLMEKDVIEYKINKKATIEFYTILIGFQLHIYPAQKFNLNDTCGYCGKENHNVYDCSETDYTIIPHNKERKYRKKFLKRQNSYTLNDNVKLSYDQIKPLMFSQRNRPNPHGRHNTRPLPNQGYQTKAPNNSTFTPRDKCHNCGLASHSTFILDNDMNNWDVNPNNANANKPTIKGKQRASDNSNNDELLNRIVHLETIIKDLSSEIMGLKITDKQHKKDIIFLKEQETRHANNMEKLNQHLTTINENMAKQAATISGVSKIVTFLENLEQNGFFSQFNDNNQAYGSNNYSYPPHDEFVTEEHLQEEYTGRNSPNRLEIGCPILGRIW